MVAQGVDSALLASACMEARRVRPDERREVLDALTGRHTLEGVVLPVSSDVVMDGGNDGA